MDPKKDLTFTRKALLRSHSLGLVTDPVVMETHGGLGRLWSRCYAHLPSGVVFEKDPDKCGVLGLQRPTWAVYEADCERAIAAGAGSHLAVNFLDCDPYGEPGPVVEAFFASDRPFPARLVVVVNDGLRQKVRLGGAWAVRSLQATVQRIGNARCHDEYLEVCRELLATKAAPRGYKLTRWTGYYCGAQLMMTHYAAVLER